MGIIGDRNNGIRLRYTRIVCEEDKGGAVLGKEVGIDEGTVKGGGTTGIGIDEERKEGRREDVRSGGVEIVADSVEEVWTNSSTFGVDGDNQLDRDEEKGR